nr:VENN motif pre-toxin domain-containing protein [Yersinia mollaretii]
MRSTTLDAARDLLLLSAANTQKTDGSNSSSGAAIGVSLGNDGHAEGTTQAAVSEGNITIRDTDKQQQNVDDLSRDTDNANGSIGPIFDKEKEQNRLKEAQLIGEIGGQAMDIARTQGDILGLEAALKANPALKGDAKALRETAEYKTEMQKYGTGSALQQGLQAATAAIQGLAGGNMAQALVGASAPYLAEVIKKSTGDNQAANVMAHAVLGAVTAYASGNSALAGAAGAATAELMAPTIIAAMGWDKDNLSEDQKQTVSALATLAAGLAGGLTGDSTADTVAGAQVGKNAVENNALNSSDEKQRQDAKWSLPYLEGEKKAQAEKLITDLDAKDKAFDAALDSACKGLSSAACQGMRQELAAMGKSYDALLDGQYIGTMASVYQEGADKVDGLLWQYATADAQAQKAKNIQTIATNWGVSIDTASALYTGMAITHTTAAIGGAVYGMKGESVSAKGNIPSNLAESALNGARLNMQLIAEQAAGAKAPTKITSYSQHALDQISGRDGGIGVSQSALDSAWSNPLKIEYAPSKYGPTFRYTGNDAVIVINAEGKVVTGWAKSSSGTAK